MRSADDIFHNAREITDPTQRAAYLDGACADDTDLRAKVEQLLRAAAELGGFLASRASGQTTLEPVPLSERAGSRIGPYKLLQTIGEGGFGTVFLAEQDQPLRRKVAIKVIKLGMDSRQVIARFEAERQALAVMNHPHIARVFDGGVTDSGRPYFVMEYVIGEAITEFCDTGTLSVPERLELFRQVCSAVQHAHTKGIIHRDLKPANVLVSMVDGKPSAKVIDFGIAKATASPLTDKTLFTEHRQLIGTPEYMSPEQAEGSPDIDTRTDVYALGVLLYELLTGLTPFDAKRLRSAAYGEMQRIIKEEEPLAPSMRLTRSPEILAAIAARRRTEPARLGPQMRGELDWIVMKALDKDRARRYESAAQLASDVGNHLAGEAVVAAPPSVGYRVRKFVRRHKAQTTLAIVLLFGLAGTTTGFIIAQFNANAALHNAEIALTSQYEAEWSAYTANIALAQAAMDAGNWPEARERLAECPETKRGWEWRWLSEKSAAVVGEVRAATTIRSPDAALVIAADWKSLRIATPDGVDIGSPIVFPSWIDSVSFSADSSAFLVALSTENLRDRAYQVFTRQGTPVGGSDIAPLIARHALLSPDGERLIAVRLKESGGYDIQLFDAAGRSIRVVAQSETEHCDTAWSGDGARVALVAGDRLEVWTRDGELVTSLDAPDDRIGKPVLSPDGSLAVFVRVPGGQGSLPRTELWTMGASEPASIPIPADFSQTVTFSPDGEYAYIRLWGHRDMHVIHDGEVIEQIVSPDDMLSDPIFSPDGSSFLLTTRTTVRVHERDGRLSGAPISHGSGWVDSACFAPDGASFYTASYHRGAIERRDLGGRLLERISIGSSLHDVACSPEGLVSASLLNPISDVATSRLLLASHAGMSDRAFSSSIGDIGRLEAAARNQDNGQRTPAPAAPPSIAQNAIYRVVTPDASRVISAAADRVVRFWDVATGKETASIRVGGDITSMELSPDGEAITIRFTDGSLRMLDARRARDQASDIQSWNNELTPAQSVVDALIAGPLDTDDLMASVRNDQSLTPIRRLVTFELLEARLTSLNHTARAAFDRIMRDAETATDAWKMVDTKAIKAHITAAAAALKPSNNLPPRAIQAIIAQAESWEYRPSEPTENQRLAEVERVVELTREQLQIKVTELEEAGERLQKQTDAAEWSAYIANIFAALSDPYSARRYLRACAEHLRNWEWRYLWASSDASRIAVLAPGDPAHWMKAEFVSNGALVAALSEHGQIVCLDAHTGNEISSSPEDIVVHHFRSSTRAGLLGVLGSRIDSTTGAKTSFAEAWDARTLQLRYVLPGEPTFSSSGERIYAAGKVLRASDGSTITTIDANARYKQFQARFSANDTDILTWGVATDENAKYRIDLWDGYSGECLHSVEGLPNDLGLYVGGEIILTTTRDGSGYRYSTWNVKTLAPIGTFEAAWMTIGAAVSPDGRHMLVRPYNEAARVYEVATGMLIQEFTDETHGVHGGEFSPDGTRIVANSGPFVCIWDVTTGKRLARLAGHGDSWINTTYSPDGSTIVSHAWDGTLRIWDATVFPKSSFEVPEDPIYRVGFETDRDSLFNGTHILAPHWDGEAAVALIDGSGRPSSTWTIPTPDAWEGVARIEGAFFSPDGTRVFTRRGSSVRAWNATTAASLGEAVVPVHINNPALRSREVAERHGGTPERHPVSLRCDDAGKRLLACLGNGLVRVYEMDTGGTLFEAKGEGYPCGTLNANGSVAAIAWSDHSLKLYDVESGRLLQTLSGHSGSVVQALFDPSGRFLATRAEDRTIRLWDTHSGAHRVLAEIDQGAFEGWQRFGVAAFSSDGSRLACYQDTACIIFDAESGETVSTLNGHSWAIDRAAFSPDGSRIFTASLDNTIRVWETATGREVLVLRPEASHEDGFDIFQISSDGTRLVARYAFDPTVHVFDTVPFQDRVSASPITPPQ